MKKIRSRSPLNLVFTGLMLTSLIFGGITVQPAIGAEVGAVPATESSTAQRDKASKIELTQNPIAVSNTSSKIDPRLSDVKGTVQVMVELMDEPAALVYARSNEQFGLNSLQSTQAVQRHADKIQQAQQTLVSALTSNSIKAQVLYQVQNAFNGIAIRVDSKSLAEIQKLAGIKSITRMTPLKRDNASSVPLIGAPTVWASYGITGANIRVGIIDTGIDYLHTNFGGPGTYTGYNDTVITDTPGLFPGPKVAGGTDLAGNDYNADPNDPNYNPIPSPDPDPLDCASDLGGGHGSHVAGTTGGYGVNADGTTFQGPWNGTVPFNSLRIGPGVAPGAKLYAIRVFGCGGSTDLVEKAIDWALDPNGDKNFADHLDVVNMSLGSDFGSPYDTSTIAAENASLAGMFMVISAGNSGDTHFVSGSPGSATRALTVASSVDATDITDGFKVNTPSPIAGIYPGGYSSNFVNVAALPVTAPLSYPANNKTGCSDFVGADAALITGTIVILDWVPPGAQTFPCGSAFRVGKAAAVGAKGVIIVGNQPYLDTAIAGTAAIPAIYTTKTVGDNLKTQVTAGTPSNTTATLSYEYKASVKLVDQSLIDTISGFTSRGPTLRSNQLKPDIAAPGQGIFSTNSGTGNKGESLNGTSMAAPHMAGVIALLRQKNPNWTVEELKAEAMNTASHDLYSGFGQTGSKYAPARVGAGRVDVPAAITTTVLAYSADAPGAVSVSFGLVEVISPTTVLTKTIKVSNKGANTANYTLGYTSYTDVPGVAYDFPNGTTLSVAGNTTVNVVVRLTANSAQVRHIRDNTVAASQVNNEPRNWLTEESGLVTLTPSGGGNALRVPIHAIIRDASQMTAPNSVVYTGPTNATLNIPLTGQGVNNGISGIPTTTFSIVTAMELAASSPLLPVTPPNHPQAQRDADLQYVGISTDSPARANVMSSTLYFGITTHGDWSTPNGSELEFDVYIDSDNNANTGNGGFDYVAYTSRIDNAGDATDTLLVKMVKFNAGGSAVSSSVLSYTNVFAPNVLDMFTFNNNVLVMGVPVAALTPGANTKINYQVFTFNHTTPATIDSTELLTYDFAKPGIDFTDGFTGLTYWDDQPGNSVPTVYNRVDYQANKSQGILLLHHFNTMGTRAQAIAVSETGACATPNIVTKALDSGDDSCGSLSYAIKQANASVNPYTITFSGTTNVSVNGPLPAITGTAAITIDGGCSVNGVPNTTIQATLPSATGLQLKTNGVTVKGLNLQGFSGYALDVQSSNNTITCNALYNNGGGIKLGTVGGAAANNNTIGNVSGPNSGNVISNNQGVGILVLNGAGNISHHTRMGVDGAGNELPANTGGGVRIWLGGHLNFGVGNKITR